MNKIKSEVNTFTKYSIWVVTGFDYAGCPHVERAFSFYSDAEKYIDQQEDGWTYTIEECKYCARTLPF